MGGSPGDISQPLLSPRGRTRVVVATTVLLGFISFWRAAAIVLNDLASSAYYAGGIAEQAAGRSAPWFILGVMLFSYAVRAVYVESCAMFTRGGVYRVVKEALGGTMINRRYADVLPSSLASRSSHRRPSFGGDLRSGNRVFLVAEHSGDS